MKPEQVAARLEAWATDAEYNRKTLPGAAENLLEAAATIRRLVEALEWISDLPGEINPSNYDHDDVCELNRQFCYAITSAAAAIK